MKNLAARLKKWDKGFFRKNLGGSLAVPFAGMEELFKGKDVLEIGPGEGRQFEVASKLANRYAVADISMVVLGQEIFEKVQTYLITGYTNALKPVAGTKVYAKKFDVIHFWYVLHHVIKEELPAFVNMLSKYCKDGGVVLFNTPVSDLPPNAYTNDGISTTKWTLEEVTEAMDNEGFKLEDSKKLWHDNSTGYVVVFRKMS